MSLEILLLAAEYVDRREAEHGYACREPPRSVLPVKSRTARPYRQRQRQVFKLSSSFNRKSSSCRSTHNELEKNRRAELRGCIEKLKSVVPLDSGCHRHTTHRLLINARKLIKSLESGLATSMEERDRQLVVQRRLQRRYHQLALISSQSLSLDSSSSSRRTGSRCSTSSNESTESSGIGDSLSITYLSSDESEVIDVECASDGTSDVDSDSGCGCDDGHLS